MKNKKIFTLIAIVVLIVAGSIIYIGQKNSQTSPTSTVTQITKLPDPAFLPPNDRKYYYDKTYYHKDPNCKNRDGYISEDKSSINGLLVQGKKPCPYCVPEDEAKENREGRKN